MEPRAYNSVKTTLGGRGGFGGRVTGHRALHCPGPIIVLRRPWWEGASMGKVRADPIFIL